LNGNKSHKPSGRDVSEYLETLGLIKSYFFKFFVFFFKFFLKKKKNRKKNVLVYRRPRG
jgi:hypothetical protein